MWTMPRLTRSPLLLAVALALVPVLALAVALGPFHRAARPSIAVASPHPSASAGLPQLIVADRFDLAAPRAFGPVDVTGIDHHGQVAITSYTLAATPPALPGTAPVWKLRGFADAPTALQARLGVSPPTPEYPGDKFDGLIDPSQARVSAGDGTATLVDSGVAPTDVASATAAAAHALAALGLSPQNADARALRTTGGWEVVYQRRPVAGIAVGVGGDVAEVELTAQGAVTRLFVDALSLDGGVFYPLRSVQDAWAQVSGGGWFDECCAAFTGAAPGPLQVAFRAVSVSLAEVQLDEPGALLLVPMYVFTDSAHRLSLTVPALTAADLVRPGGFTLTEPGAG
jgi:hypothetical protein